MVGEIMRVSEQIKKAIADSGIQQKEVAAHMGWTPQNFANRLRNNTVDGDEWMKIAEFIGYKVQMVDASNAPVKEQRKGIGYRTRRMADGITYDTELSSAICHTNEFVGSFFELYESAEGRKFIVLYADWNDEGIIMPVTEQQAQKFMDKCLLQTGQ